MRAFTASLGFKEVGSRFAFSSTHFKNLLICTSASEALAINTLSSESGKKEGELASLNQKIQGEGDSSEERVSSSTSSLRNYVRQELALSPRDDHHQFTAPQIKDGIHELAPAKTLDSLLPLAKEGRWQSLVVRLTGSPAKQNIGAAWDCFVWFGRSGKQKASLTLLELLKEAGEPEKTLSRYLQVFISSFATCYGAEQTFILLKEVEKTVQLKTKVILFEDLISVFCGRGQLSQAMDVLDQMQHRGLTLRSATFSPLLKSFFDHLMLDEAFETLRAMKRLGVQTSLSNFNFLIGACVRAGDMEKAYGVLSELQKQGIQPNTVSFNHIIKGFGQEKRLKRALSVLREMEDVGVKPDRDTNLALLRACGTSKDVTEATKLFKKWEELGLENDQTVLGAMMQVYVDNAQLDLALKLAGKLELKGTRIGVKAKSELVRGFSLAGRLEEALKVYDGLLDIGKRPSPESVATLLVALGKVGRMEKMLNIFDESNCSGSWSEYPMTYRSNYLNAFCIHICLGYIRHKRPEGAFKFLQHIRSLGMTNSRALYDKIFLQIANSGSEGQGMSTLDAADGLALLRTLKEQGIHLSRLAHETLLDHSTSLGKSEEAWEIVQEMEKGNFPLNIMSKIRLFRVFVAARKEDDAVKVLERFSKFDLLDRDVRLLLQSIMALEFQRSEAGSARDATSFRRLLEIQKQLKERVRFQKGRK